MTEDEEELPQTGFGDEQKPAHPQQRKTRTLAQGPGSIAIRLRAARLAAGLTQQQLAGTRFSKGYISAIECGKMTPSLEALAFLAEHLSIPSAYLLGEGDADLETLKHDRQLLGLLPDAPSPKDREAIRLLLAKAVAFLNDGDWYEALNVLGQGDAPPNGLFGLDLLAWYWIIGWTLCLAQRPNDAFPLLQDGLKLAEHLRGLLPPSQQERLAEDVVRLNHFLGMAFCALGKTTLAYDYHRRCRKAILAGTVRDPLLKLLIYNGLGHDTLVLGRFNESIAAYKEAVHQTEKHDNPRQRGLACWGLGVAYQESGDLQSAKENYLKAVEALKEHNNLQLLAQMRNLLGLVLVELHEYKGAEYQFRLSLELVRSLEDYRTWGYVLGNLAALYVAQGKWEEAIGAVNAGLLVVERRGDARNEGQLHLTLASVYEASQNLAAAEQELKKALGSLKHDDLLRETRARYASFLKDQGRFEEAYEQMRLLGP